MTHSFRDRCIIVAPAVMGVISFVLAVLAEKDIVDHAIMLALAIACSIWLWWASQ